jgi:hypothetical protein
MQIDMRGVLIDYQSPIETRLEVSRIYESKERGLEVEGSRAEGQSY